MGYMYTYVWLQWECNTTKKCGSSGNKIIPPGATKKCGSTGNTEYNIEKNVCNLGKLLIYYFIGPVA